MNRTDNPTARLHLDEAINALRNAMLASAGPNGELDTPEATAIAIQVDRIHDLYEATRGEG